MKHVLLALAAAGSLLTAAPAAAQDQPFVGQLSVFGFNFCPRGWAATNGQLMAINSNQALFSLLGTTYGGDGRTTFGLPDTRGRSLVGIGTGPGLPSVTWGEKGGTPSFTLDGNTMPSHTHQLVGSEEDAGTGDPANGLLAVTGTPSYTTNASSPANMKGAAIGSTGGSQAVQKRSPYLGMNVCIALVGIFPSRN